MLASITITEKTRIEAVSKLYNRLYQNEGDSSEIHTTYNFEIIRLGLDEYVHDITLKRFWRSFSSKTSNCIYDTNRNCDGVEALDRENDSIVSKCF